MMETQPCKVVAQSQQNLREMLDYNLNAAHDILMMCNELEERLMGTPPAPPCPQDTKAPPSAYTLTRRQTEYLDQIRAQLSNLLRTI